MIGSRSTIAGISSRMWMRLSAVGMTRVPLVLTLTRVGVPTGHPTMPANRGQLKEVENWLSLDTQRGWL
jgi:hypothetical protein